MKEIEDLVSPYVIIQIRQEVLEKLKTGDVREQKLKEIEDAIEKEANSQIGYFTSNATAKIIRQKARDKYVDRIREINTEYGNEDKILRELIDEFQGRGDERVDEEDVMFNDLPAEYVQLEFGFVVPRLVFKLVNEYNQPVFKINLESFKAQFKQAKQYKLLNVSLYGLNITDEWTGSSEWPYFLSVDNIKDSSFL